MQDISLPVPVGTTQPLAGHAVAIVEIPVKIANLIADNGYKLMQTWA